MEWRRIVRERLAALDLDARTEAGIVEEIALHLEERCGEERRRGKTEDEARAAALALLDDDGGAVALISELRELQRQAHGTARTRAAWSQSGESWRSAGAAILLEARLGMRSLRRRPLFAAVALVTLALGVGANTAIFSLVDAVLLRPLPYRDPRALVHVFETKPAGDFTRRELSYPDFLDLQRTANALSTVAGYDGGTRTLGVDGAAPDRVQIVEVTDGFFPMLGVQAALGRLFQPGESGVGAAGVVVLSDGAWRRRFGGDPAVIGRRVQLNGVQHAVIGVLPPDFQFPLRGLAELWLPLDVSESTAALRGRHWLDVIGRLADGQSIAQAEAQVGQAMAEISRIDPEWHDGVGVELVPLRDEITGGVRAAMLATMAATALVLLVACCNLASVLLARATEREGEFAIRAALGARPHRLLRQMLVESLVLAAAGGAAGLLVALWGARLAIAALPARTAAALPHLAGFSLHGSAFLFTLGAVLATTVLFGLAPALRGARVHPATALRGVRTVTLPRRHRLAGALVVVEVALTLVLLVGAGLLIRSLDRLLATSPGFRTENLLTLRLSPPIGWSGEDAELIHLHGELLGRLAAVPGVAGVATVSQLPLTGRGDTGRATLEARATEKGPEVNVRGVSASYFRVLGIPLVRGRGFGDGDRQGSPPVLLVNRTFELRAFGGASALGERLTFSFLPGQPWMEVVGVVADERVDTLDREVTPIVYFHQAQYPDPTYSLLVRTTDDPGRMTRVVTREIHAVDPQWPAYAARAMSEVIADSMPVLLRRYLSYLLGSFALIAAFVAAVGVYGVIAASVAQRRQEIGVRLTLGAGRGRVAAAVVGQGMRLAALGAVIGLAVAGASARLAAGLLFGVSPVDPAVLVGASAVVLVAALTACAVPALRAVRVDPALALRSE